MEDKLILKNRLKEIRTEKGLSQAQLAEMVGVCLETRSALLKPDSLAQQQSLHLS